MNDARNLATRDQVIALQTLYAQWQRHALTDPGDARAARLTWATEAIGRPLSSFSDLSCDEARRLIDGLKGSMGQGLTERPQPWRHIRSRDRAQAAGTAGRRGTSSTVVQMASPDDLARIDEAVRRLGWTRGQYEAWLKSSSSPTSCKDKAIIRTVGEANRVWWALKAMLRRSGRWHPEASRRTGRSAAGSMSVAKIQTNP